MRRNYKFLETENVSLKSAKLKMMRQWSEESRTLEVKKKELDDSYIDTICKLQKNLEDERKKFQEFMETQSENPNAS